MANIPAYMRVRQHVIDLVAEHPDKDTRIMTERELCQRFSVARTTVRKALKELIAEGVIQIRRSKGMFVNAASWRNGVVALRRHYKVMVVWGSGKQVYLDGFYMQLLERFCARLRNHPVRLLTTNLISESGKTLEELEMYNLDGVLWVRPPARLAPVIAKLRQKIPVCVVGNPPARDAFAVTMDYRQAGRLAAAWFLDRERPRTAFVGHDGGMGVKAELFTGWAEEFASRRLDYDAELRLDVACDIVARAKELFVDGVDGVFAFGSEFAAVDLALSESGKDFPVVLDENYNARDNARHLPAAKLILYPTALAELAADQLFASMAEPGFVQRETLLQPTIATLSERWDVR